MSPIQYPFAIVFQENDTSHQYVVRANDSGQAVRRARRKYQEDQKQAAPETPSRLMNLTPKQEDGKYLPRIDGKTLPVDPCDDETQAVAASVAFFDAESCR